MLKQDCAKSTAYALTEREVSILGKGGSRKCLAAPKIKEIKYEAQSRLLIALL